MVLAPEHPLVAEITTSEQKAEVESYIKTAQSKSEIERQDTSKEKTGVFTGAYAINPTTDEKIPIWIADYVLMGYGTGAIMAVPAHDERDYDFASKYNIPIVEVIEPQLIGTGPAEIHKDKEITNRQCADAIIINKNGENLLLDEPGRGIHFVGGGVDPEDKDEIDAVKREIAEETGYIDFDSIRPFGTCVNNLAFNNNHDKNFRNRTSCFEVLLKSDKQIKSEVDEGKHSLRWVKKSEVENLLDWDIHKLVWRQYIDGIKVWTDEGVLVNSGKFDGMNSVEGGKKIVKWLGEKGLASEKVNYKLRDWVYSRQRYWGEPIPIIHCEKCGAVPVPDDQLPVELPVVDHYEPSDDGQSPLSKITDWVNTTCPLCGIPAKRETDTMPNWAGSNWYYLRYFDAHNNKEFADPEKLKYWGMVDMYMGGMEHTTLHLLYSRFHHQFLYDQGLVPTPEPYASRRGHGIILAADGSKMAKSKGNAVDPTEIIDSGYGADAMRMATLFLAPYDQTTPWSPESVTGAYRFLARVWNLNEKIKVGSPKSNEELLRAQHKTIKKVSEDLEKLNFNTAIAGLMEYVNVLSKDPAKVSKENFETLLILLAPFAPHIASELYEQLGHKDLLDEASWPDWDEKYIVSDEMTIAIQVNGKLRGEVTVPADAHEEAVKLAALEVENAATHLKDKQILKTIYVPNKIINFVVK